MIEKRETLIAGEVMKDSVIICSKEMNSSRVVRRILLVCSPLLLIVPVVAPYLGSILALPVAAVIIIFPLMISIFILVKDCRQNPDGHSHRWATIDICAFAVLGIVAVAYGVPLRVNAIERSRQVADVASETARAWELMYALDARCQGTPRRFPDSLNQVIAESPTTLHIMSGSHGQHTAPNDDVNRSLQTSAATMYAGKSVVVTREKRCIVFVISTSSQDGRHIVGWSNGRVDCLEAREYKAAVETDAKYRHQHNLSAPPWK